MLITKQKSNSYVTKINPKRSQILHINTKYILQNRKLHFKRSQMFITKQKYFLQNKKIQNKKSEILLSK